MLIWTLFEDATAVAVAARDRILAAARESIAARGRFSIVLAGGSTPEKSYALLAATESAWDAWHIYFGDERCLPADHPQRNSQMTRRTLTGQVPIPASQIHTISAELGAETAAQHYSKLVAATLPFDLVLLGMGEDGHTASLFPEQIHPHELTAVPVHNAPKPPPDRVSLNTATLGSCRQLLFLITGGGKRDAVAYWRSGINLPVSAIRPKGPGEVLIDRAAWPQNGYAK